MMERGRQSDVTSHWVALAVALLLGLVVVTAISLGAGGDEGDELTLLPPPPPLQPAAPDLGLAGPTLAALPANCATCPNAPSCFPGQAVGGLVGGTQVALPANCATCPNAPSCFPGQAVALQVPAPGAPAQVAPIIARDAQMLHHFRGVCVNCHTVIPDKAIPSNAAPPHVYRGVCSNCHTILAAPAAAR